MYSALSPIAGIHGSRNQSGNGNVSTHVTRSDLLGKCLFSIPVTCSPGLEVFIPKRGMLSPGDTTVISLNSKLGLPFWSRHAFESTDKKGSYFID